MSPLFYLPRSDAFQVKKDLVVSRLAYWFFLSRDLIQRGLSSTAQTVDLPVLRQFFLKNEQFLKKIDKRYL
jgi:hypothetical protein